MTAGTKRTPTPNGRSRRARASVAFTAAILLSVVHAAPSDAVAASRAHPRSAARPSRAANVQPEPVDVLFLAAYGTDQSPGPETTNQMQAAMAGVDGYYQTVTRGAVDVSTTVVPGWHQIARALSGDCGAGDLDNMRPAAMTAAQQAGYGPGSFDVLVVLVHQAPTCTWGGGSTFNRFIGVNHLQPYTLVHEMGHHLGLFHSMAEDCDTVFTGHCQIVNYGGRFSPMGSTWPDPISLSAHELDIIGALPHNEILTVTADGNYTIGSLAGAPPGVPRVLHLPGGFSVEYRTPVGADLPLAQPAFADWRPGITLHHDDSNHTTQYDLTPGSQTNDFADGSLQAGGSFTLPPDLTVTVTSMTSTAATLTVSGMLALTSAPATPTVTFTNAGLSASVRVAWIGGVIAPDVGSLNIESSPQVGSVVSVDPRTMTSKLLPLPASPGRVRYRIRPVGTNGSLGVASAWTTPRCYFDRLQPGSIRFRAIPEGWPYGIGRTSIKSYVDPIWGATNHYLHGVLAHTTATFDIPGFAPFSVHPWSDDDLFSEIWNQAQMGTPIPPNSPRVATATFQRAPANVLSNRVTFTYPAALSIHETTISEGSTSHLASVMPASAAGVSDYVRELIPEEASILRCASARPTDVELGAPSAALWPTFMQLRRAPVATLGQHLAIRVFGDLTPEPDRCLLRITPGTNPEFWLIRIRDDDSPVGPGGGAGSH